MLSEKFKTIYCPKNIGYLSPHLNFCSISDTRSQHQELSDDFSFPHFYHINLSSKYVPFVRLSFPPHWKTWLDCLILKRMGESAGIQASVFATSCSSSSTEAHSHKKQITNFAGHMVTWHRMGRVNFYGIIANWLLILIHVLVWSHLIWS